MAQIGNCKMDRRESSGEVVGIGVSQLRVAQPDILSGGPSNVAMLPLVRDSRLVSFECADCRRGKPR